MRDCIFCKIANKEISADIVYEDKSVICFRDISPSAPVHILVVPKKHYDDILDLEKAEKEEQNIAVDIFNAISKVAGICNISRDGFRVINNCREFGGQTVNHLHFHVIGGEKLNPKLLASE